MSFIRKKGSHLIIFILINADNDKSVYIKKLESVNNDKILIIYEVPEFIKKLHKKLLTEMGQISHVSSIME